MEIEKISNVCEENQCIVCPLYDEEKSECILECCPNKWDHKEIERRLKNYGEEEN